ncbi:MAG: hypothetical protein VX698_07260 [Pseudomonadota bacterium]|nr:hypothetical protein [Pseudomonadota bacterium]
MVKGEGKTIVSFVPERRILLYVSAMIGGVSIAAARPEAGAAILVPVAAVAVSSAVIAFRGHAWRWHAGWWQVAIVILAWLCVGLASTWWQLATAPPAIDRGT